MNIKKLSSDTGIKVYVDGRLVDFSDDNVFDTDNDSVDIDYETSNSDASVEIEGDTDKLSIGNNVVKFIVKAEDGTTKEYSLIIKRNDINEVVTIDTESLNMVSGIDFVYKIFPKIIYFIFNIIK